MKNTKTAALAMALALALGASAAPSAMAAQRAGRKAATTAAALPAPAPLAAQGALGSGAPEISAKAWLLMDFDSGEVLASANADEALPPASLTKMMTSYIVEQALRSGKLKETDLVTVSERAWCRGSGAESCMYLPLGSQATVIDLLRGIVIQSGNDASKAIAEHMAGSEDAFAKMMNEQAARLGMAHTHFANATGLPDPTHRSSARDLAILARAIVRDSSAYYPLYSEREFKFNGIKQGNRNLLLYTDPTVDGLKTGHTDEAGYCLVTSAKRGGMRLITAVLGAQSAQARAQQTTGLLTWGFGSFEEARPIAAGAQVASAKVRGGKVDALPAGLGGDWAVAAPRGQSVQTQAQIRPDLQAPVAKGAVIGKVVATAGGKTLGEAPLVALADVERAGFARRAWQSVSGVFGK